LNQSLGYKDEELSIVSNRLRDSQSRVTDQDALITELRQNLISEQESHESQRAIAVDLERKISMLATENENQLRISQDLICELETSREAHECLDTEYKLDLDYISQLKSENDHLGHELDSKTHELSLRINEVTRFTAMNGDLRTENQNLYQKHRDSEANCQKSKSELAGLSLTAKKREFENSQLEDVSRNQKSEIERLRGELVEFSALRNSLHDASHKLKSQDSEFHKLQSESINMRSTIIELDNKAGGLKESIQEMRDCEDRLRTENQELTTRSQNFEAKNLEFKMKVQELEHKLCNRNYDVEILEGSVRDLRGELTGKNEDFIINSNIVETLKQSENNLRSIIRHQEEDLEGLNRNLAISESNLAGERRKNEISDDKLDECLNKLDKLSCELDQLSLEKCEVESYYQTLSIEKTGLESLKKKLEFDLSSTRKDLEYEYGMTQDLTDQISSLSHSNLTLDSALATAQRDQSTFKTTILNLETEIHQTSLTLKSQSTELESRNSTILILRQENEEHCLELSQTEHELTTLTHEFEIFQNKLKQKEAENESAIIMNTDLNTEIDRVSKIYLELKDSYESLLETSLESKRDIDTLNCLVADLKKENCRLDDVITENKLNSERVNRTNDELRKSNERLLTDLGCLRKEIENLVFASDEKKRNLENLRREFENRERELERLNASFSSLRIECDSLRSECDSLRGDYEKSLRLNKTQHDDLESQKSKNNDLFCECNDARHTIRQLDAELIITRRTLEDTKCELLNQDSKRLGIEKNLSSLHAETENRESKMVQELRNLDTNVVKMKSELRLKDSEIEGLKSALAEQSDMVKDLSQNLETLRNDFQAKSSDLDHTERELEKYNKLNGALISEYQSVKEIHRIQENDFAR
jgi:chromosome segregation ATPase